MSAPVKERGVVRIAHILPFPTVGGVEMATLRIARLLRGERFEHIAYVHPGDHGCRRLFDAAGFETRDFVAVEPSWRRPRRWWRASLALARDLRGRGIGIMHCADMLGAHHAAWAGRIAGVPVLAHIRNRFESISLRDRTFLLPVQRFAFVSEDTWRRFGLRVHRRRGCVIYDGVDVPADPAASSAAVRTEFGIPVDAVLVGVVARIAPQKDHQTLIRAAARLKSSTPGLRFLLIGDHSSAYQWSDHHRLLQRQISAAGLEDRFIFTGHREDVTRLMGALDVFVLPTHQEGLPLVILEAMAMGKPVLATDVDGVPEVVRHGFTGLLHRHEDDAQLSEQLLQLTADRALAARMGTAGRELVRKAFSSERFAAAMTALYLELAAPV